MAVIIQLHEGVAIKQISLDDPPIKIGRDPDSDIFIDDKVVSMEHAIIEVVDPTDRKGKREYYIKDLGSTNNTFVNEKAITRQKLTNEDLIRVGWTTFKFIEDTGGKGDKTLRIHKSWIPGVYYTKE